MSPVRSRRFAWLALVAMLALATLPTLGRLATVAGPHDGVAMAGRAMPPMPGMAIAMPHHMHASAASAHARVAHGHGGGEHDGHHDCVYCLLLSGLTAATSSGWMPPATVALRSRPAPAFTNRRTDAPVPALGGQGPPSIALG